MECVNQVKINSTNCLKSCSGPIISSFIQYENNENWKYQLNPILEFYDKYKIESGLELFSDDDDWKNNLIIVRIYFGTETFDIIEKDKAAKFVDMLSAIGGTMGLLTGFSIISAVEIGYFAVKIIFNMINNKT